MSFPVASLWRNAMYLFFLSPFWRSDPAVVANAGESIRNGKITAKPGGTMAKPGNSRQQLWQNFWKKSGKNSVCQQKVATSCGFQRV